MNETAAQAVAVVATKLAKMVADGHGGSKDAKAFAKEIVEVNEDEPFLPTEVNTTANLSVIQRLWEKLFHDGDYTMPAPAKKGVITKFVKGLSDEDFALVANAVTARMAKQGLPVPLEALAVSEGIPSSHRDSIRQKVRQDIVRQINEDPELDDETKAAAIAFVNELGTPPAKPPESGLEPMAHAGEVATILTDLMERGGKPTYSYGELQRAFRDADTGFRHRSFVQATKLLKERGYYPTGNVLVYNPHPASQPSEGAKEKPAGA